MGEGMRDEGRCYETREVKGHGWLRRFREEGSSNFLTLRGMELLLLFIGQVNILKLLLLFFLEEYTSLIILLEIENPALLSIYGFTSVTGFFNHQILRGVNMSLLE
jgi:hypothetical protein